ncbi:MAG: hypothetical protein ABSF35_15195 [Polyangia bacterium]|jgi:hypothetical protein
MAADITFENKTYSEREARRILLEALKGQGGQLTKADVVAKSGLPVPVAEEALAGLLKEFRSHLAATESGELIYQFDPSFTRRDAVSLREKLAKAGDALWRGFTFLFKISIVTTLVVYFVAFVVMLIAVLFARRSSDDRDSGGDMDFTWPLFWMWGWGPSGDVGPYRRPRRRLPDKPLYKKVFEFVFGPPKPPVDPLADEKEILAHIRQKNGRIAAVDLVMLMGWDFARAEEEATRLLVNYGGEPEVTDDGVVVYAFKDIRKTAEEIPGPDLVVHRAWERLESRPPLTGNRTGTNVAISLFNGFNLLAPLWIVPAFEAGLSAPIPGQEFLLHDYPLVFSSLLFAVPLGRWLVERAREPGRRKRNARRRLLQPVLAKRGQAASVEELAPEPAAAEALSKSLVALGGDVVTDDSGQIRYAFPRIAEELAGIEKVRAQASGRERDPGAIIFSSRD